MISIPEFLTISWLRSAYRSGTLTPAVLAETILQRLVSNIPPEVFIFRLSAESVQARAEKLTAQLHGTPDLLKHMPLFGIPYAVKDNIDVQGLPTTCACPAFGYTPTRSATVIERLEAAGALLIGKTNLDQFATGLVGTRSPYGEVRNPFNPDYVSGGSSSGSAAAVAHGLVAFALGTDTAGSGRVPAGFCNLVGIKPSPGLVSTRGVFPACKSLDCVSILSHSVAEGWEVLSTLAGPDADDSYSRSLPALPLTTRSVRIGIPAPLEFFGDTVAAAAFDETLVRLRKDPALTFQTVPFAPFGDVASLLYDGPWVAERRLAVGDFFTEHGIEMDPIVRAVIGRADDKSAVDAFAALYRLEAGRRSVETIFANIDLMLVPTTPTIYARGEIADEPIRRNSHLGHYTNFVNLLGMSALAMPGPFRRDGLPAGITLLAPSGGDHRLAEFARRIEPILHTRLGTGSDEPPRGEQILDPLPGNEPTLSLAVVGAHLSGMPLNWQLIERGARFLRTTRTAPCYRLYALPESHPPKPGLMRVASGGEPIELEVWSVPARHFGSFVATIPSPLGIGKVLLEDGTTASGFLCETIATQGAVDITRFGGWRSYIAANPAPAA